jgi:CRP/FNR family cyclic AMP-dependent transcriptional regulator
MTLRSELRQLEADLNRLANARQDNFVDLVSLARLDPAKDFVGADLRGTDLENLDLRQFDFRNADFRGANIKGTKFNREKILGAKFDNVRTQVRESRGRNQSADKSVPPPRVLDKLAPLRNHPLFREFPPPVIEHFGTYMTRRSARRGTTIFAKGDPGTGLMAVLWGTVKISVPSEDGREAILAIINPGEVFGEIALLDGRPREADAIAMDDCELMVIDRRDFIPFLREQPDVALRFIEILCARLREANEHVGDVIHLNLASRLAKALLRLIGGADVPAAHRNVRIKQRELGSIIGASRDTISKQLRAWEQQGWVQVQREGVQVLQPDKLLRIISGEK